VILSIIAAIADDHAIGKNNSLPWYLPEDLKFFKKTTMGKPVIMGRKTYESVGQPLPGRLNIIITRNSQAAYPDGVIVAESIPEAVERVRASKLPEAFIIGGSGIFAEGLNYADVLYLTRVHTVVPNCDAFFPEVDHSHWKLTWEEKHKADGANAFDYTFEKFERVEL
jgi:dihydrofolate reductase